MASTLPGVTIAESVKEIRFPGGGWLAVLSAESATLRGEGLDLVVIDEAAFLFDLERVWNYDLRAALSDRKGRAIFISSPAGRNYFYQLYQYGQSEDYPDWASWQATSYDNPYLDPAEIDAAKALLPEWAFRQEYLAEFVTFAGKVYKSFTPECDMVVSGEPDWDQLREYEGGIDIGFNNPTVAAVSGYDRDDRAHTCDGIYERGLTVPDLIDMLRKMQDRHQVNTWWCDPSAASEIAQMKREGISVRAAPRVKGDNEKSYVMHGIKVFETRMVNGLYRIYPDLVPPEFIHELDVYRYRETRENQAADEAPLKVDDHFPDAERYKFTSRDHFHSRQPMIMVAA